MLGGTGKREWGGGEGEGKGEKGGGEVIPYELVCFSFTLD